MQERLESGPVAAVGLNIPKQRRGVEMSESDEQTATVENGIAACTAAQDEELIKSDDALLPDATRPVGAEEPLPAGLRFYLRQAGKAAMKGPEQRAVWNELTRDEQVSANLLLVVSIARRYVGRGVSFQDLVQEGNLGLVKAVDKFDPARGFAFSTLAVPPITVAIIKAVYRQSRVIRLPEHMYTAAARLRRSRSEFYRDSGRWPTDTELAAVANMEERAVRQVRRALTLEPISLDKPLAARTASATEIREATIGDSIEDPAGSDLLRPILLRTLQVTVAATIGKLAPRDADIPKLRFGLEPYDRGHSYAEIAERHGMTVQAVDSAQRRALSKLRRSRQWEQFRGM